jgi:hypothetical protein
VSPGASRPLPRGLAGVSPAFPPLHVQVHTQLQPLLSPALPRLRHGPPQLALKVGLLGLPVHALIGAHVVAAHCGRLAVALLRGLLFRCLPLPAAGEPAWGRGWGCRWCK